MDGSMRALLTLGMAVLLVVALIGGFLLLERAWPSMRPILLRVRRPVVVVVLVAAGLVVAPALLFVIAHWCCGYEIHLRPGG